MKCRPFLKIFQNHSSAKSLICAAAAGAAGAAAGAGLQQMNGEPQKKKERGHQIMVNIWLMYGYSMVNDG
jgi:hypothetical protein